MDWTNCSISGVPTISCIPALIATIVEWAIIFASIVALFLIIVSGYKFINSGGDSKSVDSAKKTFTYAVIGLILILLSFFIVQFIATFTNTPCITTFGFNNCSF